MEEYRLRELAERNKDRQTLEVSLFLTPAESFAARQWTDKDRDLRCVYFGGNEYTDRNMIFFLPFYMTEEEIPYGEYIKAAKISVRFAKPSHRDYMGSILGLGIERDRVGDIMIGSDGAYVFCTPSVLPLILGMEHVGRNGVKVSELPYDEVPVVQKKMKEASFSVLSERLDAVAAGMFNISRTEAVRNIEAENISVNYSVVTKPDAGVNEGDVISLRGKGKGIIGGTKGTSKKGRMFIEAKLYM